MSFTRYSNGHVICDTDTFWCNFLSDCRPREFGMNNFILNFLNNTPSKTYYWFKQSDGCMEHFKPEVFEKIQKEAQEEGATLIVPTLALDEYIESPFICLPLDDQTFEAGLGTMFPRHLLPPWEIRKPIVFWRGSCAGFPDHKSRHRTVEKLIDNPLTDVKLVSTYAETCPQTPKRYFSDIVPVQKHLEYKYLLIIDGNKIASNHQWIFATGAVPIMISNKYYWFKSVLVPFVNYVPVEYDLSDLEEKIQWLVDHDEEARKIAENARLMAEEVFSSEYQKKYIENEIIRLIDKTNT